MPTELVEPFLAPFYTQNGWQAALTAVAFTKILRGAMQKMLAPLGNPDEGES